MRTVGSLAENVRFASRAGHDRSNRWSLVVVGDSARPDFATPARDEPADVRGTLLVARGVLVRLLAEGTLDDLVLMPYRALVVDEKTPGASFPKFPEARFDIGELSIDRAAREARVSGRTVDLTRREYDLLLFVCENPGRALTREALLSEVWKSDRLEMRRTVDIHVRRLRAKLGAAFPLETVHRIGYRFRAPTPSPPLARESAGSGPC